ncbi:MAG: phosphotransferase [Chloroflexia bacterium]|nr:phosphotransferase [Chloroflexia bacterium]
MLESEIAACSRLLDEVAGAPVEIAGIHGLGSRWAPVERMVLARDYPRIGRSVVVKTRRHDEAGWGGSLSNLITEQRCLAFLEAAGLCVAPELLAFDEAAGVLVMSDLGPAPSVEQVLFGSNYDNATFALIELAACTGLVHASTTSIGHDVWNESSLFVQELERPWQRLTSEAERLGFPDPRPASSDVAALDAAIMDAQWRTFTHGDLTPGNALVRDDGVRLIDFEGAGPRHAMLDGAAFRLSFPQYGRWAALPQKIVALADDAYRTELAKGLPLAEDDVAYGKAMATGCAAWALVRLSRIAVISTEDQDAQVKLRRRSQIVHTVESCVSAAEETGSFPALMTWFVSVIEEMRRRWPEARDEPKRFPAFGSE